MASVSLRSPLSPFNDSALHSIPNGNKSRSRRKAGFREREEAKLRLTASLRAAGECRLADRIAGCASRARGLGCPKHGASHLTHNRCGVEKLCPHCQEHRRRKGLRWIPELFQGLRFLFHLTLTLPSDHDLKRGVVQITAALKKLRGRQEWKRHVRGGMYFQHSPYNPQEGYHPHVHIVFSGSYWRQEEISRLWAACGGGEVVHIKRVRDLKGLLEYLLRPDLSFADYPEAAVTYYGVMRGKRLYSTFGRLYGKVTPLKRRLRQERRRQPSRGCPVCGARAEVLWVLPSSSLISRMIHCLPRPPTRLFGTLQQKI